MYRNDVLEKSKKKRNWFFNYFFYYFYYFPCPTHPARCAPYSVQGRLYTVSPSSTAFFNCSIEEAIGANIRLTTSSRGTHGEPGTKATLGNDA